MVYIVKDLYVDLMWIYEDLLWIYLRQNGFMVYTILSRCLPLGYDKIIFAIGPYYSIWGEKEKMYFLQI